MPQEFESYKRTLMDVAQEAARYYCEDLSPHSDVDAKYFIEQEAERYAYLLKLFISLDMGRDLSFDGPKIDSAGLRVQPHRGMDDA